MMRSTFTAALLLTMMLAIVNVQHSEALALIALASRPSFMSRIARLNNRRQVGAVAEVPTSQERSDRPTKTRIEVNGNDFDADAYRREMINLVYDRSIDRLVK